MSAFSRFPWRPVAAAIVSPLAPGMVLWFFSLFDHPGEGVWILMMVAVIGYPAMLLLGVPMHLLLVRIRRFGGLNYTMAGAFAGAIVAAVSLMSTIDGFAVTRAALVLIARVFGIAVLYGAFVGWTFWLIARPDRGHGLIPPGRPISS